MNLIKGLAGLWTKEEGQEIAEYAVMLTVILVLVWVAIRIIAGNAHGIYADGASWLSPRFRAIAAPHAKRDRC